MLRFVVPVFLCSLISLPLAEGEEKLSYNRDVRPILSDHCFSCHGPDAKHREADLRLDTREGAVSEEAIGVIVPGKPEKSTAWERITSDDPEQLMPPPRVKKPLSAKQKEILRRWIAEGAPYEGHWAFQPIVKSPPPIVKQEAWVKSDLDRFVLAKLEERKLAPAREAERSVLMRRVTLDLTGLLPSPEETAAFVNDERPDAYARLVERLLASPHYGERWARHWLDQARYADSNGYTIDGDRTMWPYRDWVVQAFNQDMPFSQFTIEQLGGDLIPGATKSQRIASAFHRNTMINEEGGTDAEQFRNELTADRVNTTGAVWLGLTLGCAQCHSHKFDPISHHDYYRFYAFFNSNSDANNRGETVEVLPGDLAGMAEPDAVSVSSAAAAKKKLDTLAKESQARREQWETQLAQSPPKDPQWETLDIERYDTESNRPLKKLEDGSILAPKEGAPNDTYELLANTKLKKIQAIRLEVLPHESLPGNGAGTAGNGNFVLTELELHLDGVKRTFAQALADHEKKDYTVRRAIDGNKKTGWALEMGQGGKGPHEAWFILGEPVTLENFKLTIRLAQDVNDHYLVGRFRLSASETAPETHPDAKRWQAALAAAKSPAKERKPDEKKTLERLFNELDFPLAQATDEAEKSAAGSTRSASLMIMKDLPQPRDTFLLQRGDFLNPDREAGPLKPDVPAWLPPLKPLGERANRLDLGRWLTSDTNPLTPRVTVNRVWMHYFGSGLVETDGDFGMQGTPPSHPELLDWLAKTFVEEGWSFKKLQRHIVMSATYRQASHERKDVRAIDPENRLLARQTRLRVDAEIVRDIALTASGLLDRTLGGPTIRPPQPEGVYAFTQNKKTWKVSEGADRYRRGLYITFHRSAPYPLMGTFDAPNFSAVCTRRPRSNTPLQALTLANDEAFVECAQSLAVRLWKDSPAAQDDAVRIRRAFETCYSRGSSEHELRLSLDFVKHQIEMRRADPKGAELAAPKNRPAELSAEVAAAWTTFAAALMNTDEFITRE